MNERDIIVRAPNGLYLKQLANGMVRLTNLKNATHFTKKKEVRIAMAKSGYKSLVFCRLK